MKSAELVKALHKREPRALARAITLVEDNAPEAAEILAGLDRQAIDRSLVLGLTGPPGAGKSTLTNQLLSVWRRRGERVGVIAIDPSSALSGGAVLGDRIRMMDHALDGDVVIRSMASRGRLGGLCAAAGAVARVMAAAGCGLVLIETVGVGQLEMDIARLADLTMLVLAPGLGDEIQAMKAGVLEIADLLVVNKADLDGAHNLVLDLQSLGGQEVPIVTVSALLGEQVVELADIVARVDAGARRDGSRSRRRRTSAVAECLDWAMDMVRPRLAVRIGEEEEIRDPRQYARRLVAEIFGEKPGLQDEGQE